MIRKMESRDLEQVAELEKVCFSEAWSWKLLEAGKYMDKLKGHLTNPKDFSKKY